MTRLDIMNTNDSGMDLQWLSTATAVIIIILGVNLLSLTVNSGLANAQSTMSSRYVNQPRITVDLSVLEKFGSAPAQVNIQQNSLTNLKPEIAARLPVQLLSPPKTLPRSKLTIPKSVAIKRTTTPLQPLQKSQIVVPKAITAKPPIVAAMSKSSKLPKSVEALVTATPEPLATSKGLPPISKKVKTMALPKVSTRQSPNAIAKKPVIPKVSAAAQKVLPDTRRGPKTNSEQVATLELPIGVSDGGNKVRILFAEKSSTLPTIAAETIEKLAERMKSKPKLRILLYGFARDTPDTPSKARRLSLFRALAVRTQLMNHGVRSTRMQLRALGSQVEDGPPDRVDIVVSN